jgi:hypothetical protein
MTNSEANPQTPKDAQEDDILAIYGHDQVMADLVEIAQRHRSDFQPGHHPVKQIVRKRQWAALTKKLLDARPADASKVLRYFTLPGADLLDVRVLAEVCEPLDVKIQYFGFNARAASNEEEHQGHEPVLDSEGAWVTAESALRQAGRITADAVVLSDRLEDIALKDSQAAEQLKLRAPFDVINIDACDHLAYCPKGRSHNMFDALQALLAHQMRAHTPWMLFITTRAHPDLLGQPGLVFQDAISQNLRITGSPFGASLAECLDADTARFASELTSVWGTHDARFLKLYSVGLGKFLLQFFHAQPNLPANVELASVYAYCVHGEQPDMLALAFRISPDAPRVFAPSVGGVTVVPGLEPERASKVAKQAGKLQDLDYAIANEPDLCAEAISGTSALLESAKYDLTEWRKWLAAHEQRPMIVT